MKEKALYWSPRILAILAILFMLMFSFDAFDGNEPLGRKLLGFLIHNIPVLILTAIVVVAWNRELPGGIILIAVAFCANYIFPFIYDQQRLPYYFHTFYGYRGFVYTSPPAVREEKVTISRFPQSGIKSRCSWPA